MLHDLETQQSTHTGRNSTYSEGNNSKHDAPKNSADFPSNSAGAANNSMLVELKNQLYQQIENNPAQSQSALLIKLMELIRKLLQLLMHGQSTAMASPVSDNNTPGSSLPVNPDRVENNDPELSLYSAINPATKSSHGNTHSNSHINTGASSPLSEQKIPDQAPALPERSYKEDEIASLLSELSEQEEEEEDPYSRLEESGPTASMEESPSSQSDEESGYASMDELYPASSMEESPGTQSDEESNYASMDELYPASSMEESPGTQSDEESNYAGMDELYPASSMEESPGAISAETKDYSDYLNQITDDEEIREKTSLYHKTTATKDQDKFAGILTELELGSQLQENELERLNNESWQASSLMNQIAAQNNMKINAEHGYMYDRKTGVIARLLQNHETREARLNFASSGFGSEGLAWKHWLGNIRHYFGGTTGNFEKARELTEATQLALKKEDAATNRNTQLILSGLSKGAQEATYAALSQKEPLRANVFAAPALHKNLLKKIPEENLQKAPELVTAVNITHDPFARMHRLKKNKKDKNDIALQRVGTQVIVPREDISKKTGYSFSSHSQLFTHLYNEYHRLNGK